MSVTRKAAGVTRRPATVTRSAESVTRGAESVTRSAGNVARSAESVTRGAGTVTPTAKSVTPTAESVTPSVTGVTPSPKSVTPGVTGVTSNGQSVTPSVTALQDAVRRLARERQAVILAHNYQVPEIQDVADFVGDSLGLAIEARRTDAPVIVMCGVYFMAETAKILNPSRTVLIPDLTAGCSLADSITLRDLKRWKLEHPGAVVVSYVNTTAAIKAESDYCVTSGNAEAIVRSIPADREILFLPDQFLGAWLKERTGRENMHIWLGECHVHAGIRPDEIRAKQVAMPGADLLIHPECGCASACIWANGRGLMQPNTYVLSTEGMVKHAAASQNDTFLVATETGILHRLHKEIPGKQFVAADEGAVCGYMKQITLEKLRDTLRDMAPEVDVPERDAARARQAIDRMLAVTV